MNLPLKSDDPTPESEFLRLLHIVGMLRDPIKGCPWDKEQTHKTLARYMIEESYEAVDAIESSRTTLKEELGDVLFQVLLHSQIASERDDFDISAVMTIIADKMIRRHPHVFGDVKVKNAEEVRSNWEQIKAAEKGKDRSKKKGILDDVTKKQPALAWAQRISEKAARAGFEWTSMVELQEKVFEEIRELAEVSASPTPDRKKIAEEFGDVMFTMVQLARKMEFDAETLMRNSADKFTKRIEKIEELSGKPLDQVPHEEMDRLWIEAKKMGL